MTPGKRKILDSAAAHVCPNRVRTFEAVGIDLVIGRREGYRFWDVDGRELLDFHLNGGVFNLGHRNPELVATLRDALDTLDVGNHHFPSAARAGLAEALIATMPGELEYVVFAPSGGEAIEVAIKTARHATGRRKIVSIAKGYHGHTGLALAAGDERFSKLFLSEGAPGLFVQVPFNDLDAMASALGGGDVAAVILETIPATYGFPMPASGYLPGVKRLCERFGSVYIADEVQTGLGRTGKLWGIEHFGVVPDIIVIGKGLSGGLYPMSATCFRAKYEAVFQPDPFIHISTFGGAEVGCPVAMKVLEIVSDQRFLQQVQDIAAVFAVGFDGLKAKYPEVLVGLRQLGMMMGIEMADERCGPLFSKVAFDHGLLSVYANNDPRVSQLLPPLIIDRTLADEIIDRVDQTLQVITAMLGGR